MEEFASHFHQRLRGLATSHDVLVDQNWQGAPLAVLVNLHVAPFVGDDSSRLGATGPAVVVTATAAQAIGLALNELATNAAKYGSLSTLAGRVAVAWSFEDDSGGSRRLNLTWAERGGPLVKAPSRKGFGHLVIERMVANSLDGRVAIDFAPHGVTWTLSIPAANTVAGSEMRS
jgi:two-component sensor histidine kinase